MSADEDDQVRIRSVDRKGARTADLAWTIALFVFEIGVSLLALLLVVARLMTFDACSDRCDFAAGNRALLVVAIVAASALVIGGVGAALLRRKRRRSWWVPLAGSLIALIGWFVADEIIAKATTYPYG